MRLYASRSETISLMKIAESTSPSPVVLFFLGSWYPCSFNVLLYVIVIRVLLYTVIWKENTTLILKTLYAFMKTRFVFLK